MGFFEEGIWPLEGRNQVQRPRETYLSNDLFKKDFFFQADGEFI